MPGLLDRHFATTPNNTRQPSTTTATAVDDATTLKFLDHLQKQNYDSLGFLSRGSLTEYVARRQTYMAFENGEPCGYLLFYDGRNRHRPIMTPDTLRIRQACICYDLRRIAHGNEIVTRLAVRAQRMGFRKLACWVGSDLPANKFWTALGFVHDGTRTSRGRKHPTHFHYTYHIPAILQDYSVPAALRL